MDLESWIYTATYPVCVYSSHVILYKLLISWINCSVSNSLGLLVQIVPLLLNFGPDTKMRHELSAAIVRFLQRERDHCIEARARKAAEACYFSSLGQTHEFIVDHISGHGRGRCLPYTTVALASFKVEISSVSLCPHLTCLMLMVVLNIQKIYFGNTGPRVNSVMNQLRYEEHTACLINSIHWHRKLWNTSS